MAVKMALADLAMRDHDLAKADVPDAYMHGKRQARPITFMALPTTLGHMRAEDGSRLCVQLGTPCWGECAAGYEWSIARNKKLTEFGWRPAEDVPDLWLFTSAKGMCRLLIVVDDLFFTEDKALKQSLTKALCKSLSKTYGDVRYDANPTSFKGYKIERDRPGRRIKLTFPQKILEAVREHLPDLLE